MRLMVLRHASSEKAEPGMRDFDRALNERGRKDAAKIGAYMAHHALLPDRVIVSPARRARETWEHVSEAFPVAPPVDYDNRLYEGGPDAILAVIKETDPSIRSLLIIGHNPGLHETARLLIAAIRDAISSVALPESAKSPFESRVSSSRERSVREAWTDGLRNVERSRTLRNFLHAPIRELYMNAVSHNVGPAGVLNLSVY